MMRKCNPLILQFNIALMWLLCLPGCDILLENPTSTQTTIERKEPWAGMWILAGEDIHIWVHMRWVDEFLDLTIVYPDDTDTVELRCIVDEIDGVYYLNAFGREDDSMDGYFLYRLRLKNHKTLYLDFFDNQKVKNAIKESKLEGHINPNRILLNTTLTLSTKELRRFLRSEQSASYFKAAGVLERIEVDVPVFAPSSDD